MATVELSKHDINVLEKIKDPESNPTASVVTDETLPRDPHIIDTSVYERIVAKERQIIQAIQKLEMQLSQSMSEDSADTAIVEYKRCAADLDDLISEHPKYASARNNRAQVYRRLHGDAMLLSDTMEMPMPLIEQPDRAEKMAASRMVLDDLERSIALLSPPSLSTPLSPQAARTLSMAHTQRAAIYLKTAKLLSHRSLDMDESRRESQWGKLDFEEAASRDLALGGRYGNQIAKGLAVSVNPTAKLCGQIVRQAMKEEYGPAYGE
ncbi:hypothetical protein ACRE_078180 [Hapsidospora chrysogenum ATCC 11550]|uniref:Tetratricopeptide repeat protein-like protein n=1 Tax=Hapsidospora chrysogenum (strain ATCC 11550 / CBS 779.69 / DSM 880 / IAM 14645 / JCM 23072 / IMI 49137) TaxID=857340 RepID=A0A086SWJ1_HAPC1|nr:hypothetical protein ACRE_078180 [Hapsidospora chrysogenum ATCC 11550]